jgi:transposase-like protein
VPPAIVASGGLIPASEKVRTFHAYPIGYTSPYEWYLEGVSRRPGFPSDLLAFQRRFSSERACFDYLIEARWPDGFACPACGGVKSFMRGDRLAVQCMGCRRYFSATAGTVMNRTRQPLASWLLAAYLMVTSKRGLSADELRRHLGLARYEPAFLMLHKLRAAMVDPERTRLGGIVEVDETLVGGVRRGAGKGTWRGAQQAVIGAIEVRGGKSPGRIRLYQLPQPLSVHVLEFLKQNVDLGATVRTDASHLYDRVVDSGFNHDIVSVAHGARQEEVLPTLHLAFANLKAWLQGTFHGAVRKEHLQAYLDEFTFRFNRRGNLQAAFQRVLGIGTTVQGPTHAGLYRGTRNHSKPLTPRQPAGLDT